MGTKALTFKSDKVQVQVFIIETKAACLHPIYILKQATAHAHKSHEPAKGAWP